MKGKVGIFWYFKNKVLLAFFRVFGNKKTPLG